MKCVMKDKEVDRNKVKAKEKSRKGADSTED